MNFPKREYYEEFVKEIADDLRFTSIGICFYLYGSFTRNNDFVPGRSDLDGGFIFDSEFVTPKPDVEFLARRVDVCLKNAEDHTGLSNLDPGISINFNLMDRGINKDGRFLAYDDTYSDYLKSNARIATGPDFIQEMNGMNYKRESLRSAAYNLRKVRNGLLTYFLDLRKNPQRARKNVLSSMNVLYGMPKKLLETLGMELEFKGGAFFETFKEIFPNYDAGVYKEAIKLRQDPRMYFGVLNEENPYHAFQLNVTATEEMIQAYINRCPFPTRLEVNSLD